jgi:hypothetical protein
MKILPPVGRQLSKVVDEKEVLRKENHKLRQELCAARTELARLRGRKPPKPNGKLPMPPPTRGSTSLDGRSPSYAQPTKASRLRSCPSAPSSTTSTSSASTSPPSTPTTSTSTSPWPSDNWVIGVPTAGAITVGGKDCIYEDGKLKVMQFGFLKNTMSRINYEMARYELYPRKLPHTRDWMSDRDCVSPERGLPAQQHRIMEHAYSEDEAIRGLIATRTRLADKEWMKDIANVYINHDRAYEILFEALTLAKRCVWQWARTRGSSQFKYLSDIDFGRDRITPVFSHMPFAVDRKLEDLISMRNRVCHFQGGSEHASNLDHHIENVQEFAVLLHDEESAHMARELRDKVRTETEKALEEIETLTMLSSLPGAGDLWLEHQSDTVRMAIRDLYQYDSPPRHRVIDRAAREWASHQRDSNYGRGIPEVGSTVAGSSIFHAAATSL